MNSEDMNCAEEFLLSTNCVAREHGERRLNFKGVTVTLWHIGAAICDFEQCGILTSVDSDEPVHPLFHPIETSNNVRSVA